MYDCGELEEMDKKPKDPLEQREEVNVSKKGQSRTFLLITETRTEKAAAPHVARYLHKTCEITQLLVYSELNTQTHL